MARSSLARARNAENAERGIRVPRDPPSQQPRAVAEYHGSCTRFLPAHELAFWISEDAAIAANFVTSLGGCVIMT